MSSLLSGALLAPTPRLWSLKGLKGFFPEAHSLDRFPRLGRRYHAVLGFDGGQLDVSARRLARVIDAPFVSLDSGLICSVGGPASGAQPISILADAVGPHFDPTRPSALEALLDEEEGSRPELLDEARDLMAFKREQGLSRYNAGRPWEASPPHLAGQARVLVVDQHRADPSIALGLVAPDAFVRMIQAARAENPRAQLVVLRPLGCGGDGQLRGLLRDEDAVIDSSFDIMSVIELVDSVYVVSSLVGLDAVLAGRPVTCFGAPFYAGWGLTDDRCGGLARRSRRLSVEALFAGAYLRYARYVDPLSGEACAPRLAFERLAVFKRHAARVAGRWAGLNIPPPKHPVLKAFVVGPRSTYSTRPHSGTYRDPQFRLAAWASKPNDAVRAARLATPDQVVNIEDGFLRSVGLGSNFHPASSLVLDGRGIYYDPSQESDLEWILNHAAFEGPILERAQRLRSAIVEMGLSKYNLPSSGVSQLKGRDGRCTILVPGQVEDDASVLTGGLGWSNLTLLRTVREQNPEAFIAFKEHPDVTAGNRAGRVSAVDIKRLADLQIVDIDVIECINAADEIHTLTSLTGFEALLRGKTVVTYGAPFYGGWGLTRDLRTYPRPRRTLSLDALVAGALLIYPLYVDPTSRLPCDAETFVQRLKVLRSIETKPPMRRSVRAQFVRGMRAAAQVVAAQQLKAY